MNLGTQTVPLPDHPDAKKKLLRRQELQSKLQLKLQSIPKLQSKLQSKLLRWQNIKIITGKNNQNFLARQNNQNCYAKLLRGKTIKLLHDKNCYSSYRDEREVPGRRSGASQSKDCTRE
jgi:hypothetical protein